MIETTCSWVREALSAQLDDEELALAELRLARIPGQGAAVIDVEGHLVECADCRTWFDEAQLITRTVRVRAIEPVPDLTARIMAAVAADPVRAADQARRAAEERDRARRQILRIAVAVAALAQLALALPTLASALLGHDLGPHASREMASFDAAVAVGFLLAALRPDRARGYVPVALVLAACLAVTSGVDVARGMTTIGHEFGHLVAVAQAGLIWVLGRVERDRHPVEQEAVPAA